MLGAQGIRKRMAESGCQELNSSNFQITFHVRGLILRLNRIFQSKPVCASLQTWILPCKFVPLQTRYLVCQSVPLYG
ncbi:hypothetical protein J6590_026372 [Homalodisca vitripennis]|nr:hypothetical protein J6590_026372 [Homalodisca vitripennis]